MKKIFLLVALIPCFTFGQLSKEDKKSINTYADNICGCINNLMNELDSKAIEFVRLMGEKGEENALKELTASLEKMNEEDTQELLASFEKMESTEFINRIDNCDDIFVLTENVRNEVRDAKGEGYTYFLGFLNGSKACELTKIFLEIGTEDKK